MGASRSRASSRFPCCCYRRPRLVAARSSRDLVCWRRVMARAWWKHTSASAACGSSMADGGTGTVDSGRLTPHCSTSSPLSRCSSASHQRVASREGVRIPSVFPGTPLAWHLASPRSQAWLRGCDIGCTGNQGGTGLRACYALPSTAQRRGCLSPAVAGKAALYRVVYALQLLERKALQVHPADWHRFCLLLEDRESRGLGESPAALVRQVGTAGLGAAWPRPLP